jgi:hypothetical protein
MRTCRILPLYRVRLVHDLNKAEKHETRHTVSIHSLFTTELVRMARKGECKPSPEWWNVQQKAQDPEITEAELRQKWTGLTKEQRNTASRTLPRKRKRLEKASVILQNAPASQHTNRSLTLTRLFVEQGGRPKAFHDAEKSLQSRRDATTRSNHRVSKGRQQLAETFRTGCATNGCPYTSPVDAIPDFYELDHIDPSQKKDDVGSLFNEDREAELKKVQCLCLWHHFLKTARQRRFRPVQELPNLNIRKLAELKTSRGCQAPFHSTLLKEGCIDFSSEVAHGFLEVSHLRRQAVPSKQLTPIQKLDDILESRAEVHCKFCHKLYTLCELQKLFPLAPYVISRFRQLQVGFPQVIEYFEAKTRGYDWEELRKRSSNRTRKQMAAEDEGESVVEENQEAPSTHKKKKQKA